MGRVKSFSVFLFVIAALTSFTGCGGGGGGSDSSEPVATTNITGSVFSAPVAGAEVSVVDAGGNTIAGPVATAADGTFNINIPTASLSSDLRIESSGGTFADEATGASSTAGTLAAYVPSGSLSAGVVVNIDPSSTIIYHLVTKYGKTLADAKTIFATAFRYTPDTSVAPKNAPSSGNDKSQSLAGLRAITFSQLTKDLGLAPETQFDLLAALAQDLADGALDGRNGAAQVSIGAGTNMPEDIQNRFESSLRGLMSNTTVNLTGLTADQIGSLPFSKVALTDTYRVQYIPGAMPAAEGKTTFTVKITKRSDGSAATGLSVTLMPKMNMAGHSHSTPVDTVVEDSGNPGTYKCTVYYLMASTMASGMSMGYWELKVMIGPGMSGETACFCPQVGMAMGSTPSVRLRGVNDLIPSMTGTTGTSRTYLLFNDGLNNMGGTYTLNLFIAVPDDAMMMSFPAVSVGTQLHDQNGAVWTVTAMTVEASTDGANWVVATDKGSGHWSVAGLTGLSSGVGGSVYVRVTVNGEQKTTDGLPVTGTNGHATFTVIPGM
jgi:hypothetical protein